MSAITIRIPESLHNNLKRMAKQEGVSANQFIASAAAEKTASILTVDFLQKEAAQGTRGDFERFLAAVPE
jgi:uncharacterized protein (DUF1778 family)